MLKLNNRPGAGLLAYSDANNSLNRIIYSSIREVNLSSINKGISIKYVSKGTEFYEINGKPYHVHAGEFLVVNHGQPLEISLKSKTDITGVCLYFDPCLISQKKLEITETVYRADQTTLLPTIQTILDARKRGEERYLSDSLFYDLAVGMHQIQDRLTELQDGMQACRESTRLELIRRLSHAQQYIHDCFDQDLSIRQLAQVACLSEFHFLRSFKQCFGRTPNQYIRQVRMEKAKEWLKEQSWPIFEIAERCGYRDHRYFTRVFKNTYGATPSTFKQSLQTAV